MTRIEILHRLIEDIDNGISAETTLKRLLLVLLSDEQMAATIR